MRLLITQTISEVTLSGISQPTANGTVSENTAKAEDNANYEVTETKWYTGEDGSTVFEGEKFGYGTAYTVKITLTPKGDYKFGDSVTVTGLDGASVSAVEGEGGKILVTKTYEKTAEKTTATVTTAPIAKTDLKYTGEAQALVTAGETSDGTLKYSLEENGEFTDTIPTGTNAGEYTVYYKVVGDESHNDSEVGSVKVKISKADVTVKASNQTVAEGKVSFAEPTVEGGVEGEFSYNIGKESYTSTDTLVKNKLNLLKASDSPVTVTYTFTPTNTTNYNTATGTITVTIANLAFKVGEDEITSETEASSIATIKENPTYGDSWGTIVSVKSEVKAHIGEKEVQGNFSVKETGKPTAGEDKEYTIVFNSTDGNYKDITVFTGKVSVAQKEITIGADSYTVTKEYDGKTTAGEGSGNLTLSGVENGDEVSVEVVEIGEYSAADVTDNCEVELTVNLTGEAAANYKLKETTIKVTGKITAKKAEASAKVTGTYTYTGSAITPTVEVTVDGKKLEAGDYTVECNAVDAGKATATIKAASGKNFTFDDINIEFEIAKAKLTATGEGKATGAYGAKLSELIVSGLTAKLGEKTIEGAWAITGAGSDAVPNVGDTEKYTATFTPTNNAGNFETLTAEVSVEIAKSTYSTTISDTAVSFNKNTSGKKTVQLALPVISGFEITKATATAAEGVSYITELSCDKTGKVSFEITAKTDSEGERTSAEITVTLSSVNYEDITAKVKITFTAAEDQEAPEKCNMTYALDENGTYTVTIEKVDGAEYSFDGTTFRENNTKSNVAAGTTVTGYIRMKAVEASGEGDSAIPAKNASPATSATITTPKAVSAAPTITTGAKFKESIEVTITATDGAATIYYTTDGSNPTTSSTKYTGAFTLTKTATVKAIAVSTGKEPSEVVSATFTKESSSTGGGSSSGGSRPSGGSYGGGSSSSTKTNPTVDGKEKTWADTAKDIEKLPAGKEVSIEISGSKEIPADVIKAIAKSDAKINVEIDNAFSWTIDGSDINEKDAKAADLTINKASVSGTNALRGISGTSFKLNGTNVNSKLNISFKAAHAGKFANLFKKVDGKFVFVDNVKIDKNGNAIGLDVSEKGEYVVMLGEFSDRTGDMDNDGIVSAYDALAVLKESVGLEKGVNPLVADLDGDGFRSAMDALAILKMTVGLL